jgi:hypothetical protein
MKPRACWRRWTRSNAANDIHYIEDKLKIRRICAAALFLTLPLPLFAADIIGTVTNKTTNKPAVGDDVVLLELKSGMQEVTRAKTDAQGKFTLHGPDTQDPHLVRVNHRNVNYFKAAPPGTTQADIDVYDAAERLTGVAQSIDVMRIEADAGNIHVVEMYSMNNSSQPPRTLMGAKSFEIVLPDGAKVEQSLAAGPGGMPVNSPPLPTGEKNHYTFLFPIRPGETRFQIGYSMPYSGSATISPKVVRATDNFAVSVPKSMQLTPAGGSKLQPKGEDAGMAVYVAQNIPAAANVSFTVSGTGSVPLDNTADQAGAAGPDQAGTQAKPGGGLGEPVNSPDPLYKYRWWLIGTVALALIVGAGYIMGSPAAKAGGSLQLALKDELFQLESDRLENKISPEEYAKAKSALDVLMSRAASRKVE